MKPVKRKLDVQVEASPSGSQSKWKPGKVEAGYRSVLTSLDHTGVLLIVLACCQGNDAASLVGNYTEIPVPSSEEKKWPWEVVAFK